MKITIAIAFALLTIGVNATINPVYEEIQTFKDGAFEKIEPFGVGTTRDSWILFINRMRKEIKGLIEEFDQCNSYESDALKGTCFTHWSLRLASDIKQFVEAIKNWSDDEFVESRDAGSTIILINKLRKEIVGLIDEFDQCNSYDSDALKGTCFTHWSIRLANDIKQFVEYIKEHTGDELPEAHGVGGSLVLISNIKKEAKFLIDEYNRCISYKSDVKKGKCFIGWAKIFATDAIKLAKLILSVATPCKQRANGLEITKDVVCTLLLVTTDVKDLIALFHECEHQVTDARKGLCFTRFALEIIGDTVELVVRIIRMFRPSSLDFNLLDEQNDTPLLENYYHIEN